LQLHFVDKKAKVDAAYYLVDFLISLRTAISCFRRIYLPARFIRHASVAVWCSGNALVLINAVALHRARLVLGWVTAFG